MNREILFKAKRKDNGKWVEGYYCKLDETTYCISEDYERHPVPTHHYILYETMTDWGLPNRFLQFEIDPDTLCQYIGLTDKNGKKIWENDIVECNKRKEECGLYKVVWRKEYADFGVVPISNTCIGQYPIGFSCGKTLHGSDYKSIGNIFDNADLLEVDG